MRSTVLLAALMLLDLGVQARAAQRPRQAPIEFRVPKPPTPVITGGKRVLVYEIHITNFGSRPLLLRQVDVSDANTATPLLSLEDSVLRRSLRVLGSDAMMMGDAQPAPHMSPIAVGGRAVVFVWIALPRSARVPLRLRHRLSFDPVAADTTARAPETSTIDSLDVAVLSSSPPVLRPPVPAGTWLAGYGASNSSDHRRTLVPLDGSVRISQRFAIDWVMVGKNGNTWHDDRTKNENYWDFGQPVRAVAGGVVTAVVDSIADNVPHTLPAPTIATLAGNHVITRVAPGVFVMFAHLKRGSVRVRRGQTVHPGEIVGNLGNSGQSTAPHLHFQVMDASSPLAAEGIPFVFDRFGFLGLGQDYDPDKALPAPVTNEMPLGEAVIEVP
jgi:Peptidase family M23